MSELPSMEEFEKLARESDPTLFDAVPDATGFRMRGACGRGQSAGRAAVSGQRSAVSRNGRHPQIIRRGLRTFFTAETQRTRRF